MSSSPGAKRLGSLGAILARVRRSAGRGTARSIRRARRLRLEGLEHRQLLSVSPLVLPASPVEDVGAITSTELPGGDPSAESEPLAPATNAPPTAVDDAFSMTGNQQLGAGVLANDVDPDGDPLSVTLDSDASHGTLNLGSDGLFTYKPDEGFAGTDAFTYVANDGQAGSDPATVTISVASVNGPPRAENDVYATGQNQQLLVAADSGVLANDSDAQGDPLTTTLVEEPAHGTLALNADGSFEYTPETDFRGQDAFTYRASDGQSDSNLATASITVGPTNEAPQTVDDTYSTREDEPLSAAAAGVLANDTDADGDQLTAILESAPSHGTLTLGLDGSFDYTPNPDFSGSDSFTYLANDGQVEGNLATVSITIEPVNDAPVAVDDAYSVNEDETLVVEAAGVLTNDADVEGDLLAAVLVDGPAQGTLTLADDGSFEYTPNADFNGSDSFTYLANDGQAESNLATVSITIEPVNDAPVAVDDAYSVNEDETLVVEAAGVLTNDADVEGDLLAAVLVDG
ncbi:MAG TPA: cadherin-like domain-containing protein, partial [Thermoguttaceae bacterium]|nr:cadherin-like domain-containing protein [Thermoguttaceae bacterium]